MIHLLAISALSVNFAAAASDDACVLPADFNLDGQVGISDYISLLSAFGTDSTGHDLDANGTVGSSDLRVLLQSYGKTMSDISCDPERENIDYQFEHTGNVLPDDEGFVDAVYFEAVVRVSIENLKICWKEDGQLGNPCWYNQDLVVGDEGVLAPGVISLGAAEDTWLGESQHHISFGVNVEPDTTSGLDPIECGVTYNFELQNGFWNDDELVTISCEAPEEDEEACTDCPDGGVYDDAHCFFGTAPAGTVAGYNAAQDVWTYTPADNTCERFDEMLRDGSCVWDAVPEGAAAFAYGPTNGFYTHPECE